MSCGRPSGGVSATAAVTAASTAAQQQLRHAAFAGDAATCRRLLAGARCVRFSRDQRGRSALHLAAAAGRATVVRLLLAVAAPGEADAPDGDGCAPLQTAAADGHEEVVRLLLARGADVDGCDSVHSNTALHEAAWKGYSRTVRLLAAAGATLTKANAGGFTALHLCCQNGHNQCCRELLLAGCDPDVQNNYGDTALHTAARYGHAGVTRILISGQCRVSEQNKNGDTALHIAAAMGRRKLTRILLEAGCDKCVRNKQGETARDIALRKELTEIVDIVDECATRREKKANKQRKRSKSKVRFEGKHGKDTVDNLEKTKHWSPYGCHYYPDPEAFPSPRLDSLPHEPLKKGEQYYLDLAGNICKGPVGVGYTCYCAPLFRHLEARLEKDKRELQRAQLRLGQRVAGLEQRLERGRAGRRSERPAGRRERGEAEASGSITRSRSLEMLDQEGRDAEVAAAAAGRSMMQATRSMDELENQDDDSQRPSVKELVARIQQQTTLHNSSGGGGNNSESSDDEDKPLRMSMKRGPMGDSNLAIAQMLPNYENVPNDAPRSRSGVYSPTIVNTAIVDQCPRYIEPIVKVQEPGTYSQYMQPGTSKFDVRYHQHNTRFVDPYREQYEEGLVNTGGKYYEHNLSTKLAKLRVLENVKQGQMEAGPSTNHDNADRDTNNDSGYSTKVYGSSKGNSPSLSGQIDGGECLGASSLV